MGKSKDSSSNTKEEMDRSGSEAMDSVEMISIIKEGESNEITTNSIGLEDASGLNIVSKEAVRTSHTEQFPAPLIDGVSHLDQHAQGGLHQDHLLQVNLPCRT